MTLEEKIELFRTSAIDNATKQSISMISNYEQTAKNDYEEYKNKALIKYENQLKLESSNMLKKKNQRLTSEILDSKRHINNKSNELKDNLFDAIENKLRDYKKTDSYLTTLIGHVDKVKKFAKTNNFTIYLDKDDSKLKSKIEEKCNVKLSISDTSFSGGIKAIIHNKNILIDESFASKLNEERAKFSL